MSRSSTFFVPPNQQRHMRACMVCSIVQLQARFLDDGCPNCEDVLHMTGSIDVVQDCTSQVYEGLVLLVDPRTSWVAKWQRLSEYVPGTYAVKVIGILPEDIITRIEEAGIKFIPRDGTDPEEVVQD